MIPEPENVHRTPTGLTHYLTALAKVWYTRLWKSSINWMASFLRGGG